MLRHFPVLALWRPRGMARVDARKHRALRALMLLWALLTACTASPRPAPEVTPPPSRSTPSRLASPQPPEPTPPDATLLAPLPNQPLPGSTVTFVWADVAADGYALDIGTSPGGADVFSQHVGTATQITVADLPTDGRALYVRLWTVRGGQWNYTDYTYHAAQPGSTAAPMTPTPRAAAEPFPPLPRLQVHGEHFVDDQGRVFRCWGVNVVAFYPDEATAQGFAQHLAERGVNCVRWHHMLRPSPDWITQSDIVALNTYEGLTFYPPDDPRARRCPDSDQVDTMSPHFTSRIPDPEAWRRFDYLNAQLQKHGIYIMLSVHWTRDYGTNDVDVPPFGPKVPDRDAWQQAIADLQHRANCWGYASVMDLQKMLPTFDERALALEKEFLTTLLTHVNPYTGLAYKDSPQVLTLEMVNEFSSIYTIVNGNRYYDDRWTQGFPGLRYFQDQLEARWRMFLTAEGVPYFDLYLEAPSPVPYEHRERLRVAFLYGLDQAYYQALADHLDQLGAQVPLTFSTLWRGEPDAYRVWATEGIAHAENHVYANPAVVEPFVDHPDEDGAFFTEPAHPYEDFIYSLAVTQSVAGKPHIVGEINLAAGASEDFAGLLTTRLHKRSMQLLAAAAYGRLHDWAGVMWFAWNHGDARVAANGRGRNERAPHDMTDPADREAVTGNLIEDAVFLDHLRTAGWMFTQGLVATSTAPIVLHVPVEGDDALWSYVAGYPVRPYRLPVPGWPNISAVRKVYGAPPPAEAPAARPRYLEEPPHPLVSDTGQIVKDVLRGQLTVDAPQAEAFSGYLDAARPAGLDVLRLDTPQGFATVILVALDGRPLEASRHLLISRTYVAGVTGPDDIAQGHDADGPAITLVGVLPGPWEVRFTRTRGAVAAGTARIVAAADGLLALPAGAWREAELVHAGAASEARPTP